MIVHVLQYMYMYHCFQEFPSKVQALGLARSSPEATHSATVRRHKATDAAA